MKVETLTGKKFLMRLYVMHNSMALVTLLFFALVLFFKSPITRNEAISEGYSFYQGTLFITVLSLFALLGFVLGELIARRKYEQARRKILLTEKAKDYYAARFIKYILLVIPTLLAVTIYIMFPFRGIMILTFAVLALLAINYPSRSRMVDELDLSIHEKKILNDSEKLLSEQNLNY